MGGKIVNVRHYSNFSTKCFFIPALFIGTSDFYDFIALSLTLTLAGVSR